MEKDNKEEIAIQRDNSLSTAMAAFVGDPTSWYLYKKSEKISKAFFLLTRHMPEGDMLKSGMRKTALDLLSKAQALLAHDRAKEAAAEVVLEVLSLISLSDTALTAELQSERNHSIVVRELEAFIKDLSTWSGAKAAASYIPSALFDMSDIAYAAPVAAPQEDKPAFSSESPAKRAPIRTAGNTINNRAKEALGATEVVRTDIRKGTRQDSILHIIRSQGEVSIKDLVAVIKGCSEKTIQRELIALVSAGVLSKTGERRWSRYSIIGR